MGDAANHDIGQHIHALDEIELLKDHGAGRAPKPQIATLQGRDVLSLVEDRPPLGSPAG